MNTINRNKKNRKRSAISVRKTVWQALLLLTAACLCITFGGCADRTVRFLEQNTEAAGPAGNENEEAAPEIPEQENQLTEEKDISPEMIYVDVCGAVKNPGVYALPSGSRVYEAVGLAGGFTEDACGHAVNQAGILDDAVQLYIPTLEEYSESGTGGGNTVETSGLPDSGNGLININTAGMDQLCGLPGIGESKAAAILSYREQYGPFGSVDELMQVSGIKEGTLEKIRELITV